MGVLNITEFESTAKAVIGSSMSLIAPLPGITAGQNVSTSGTSAQSSAFNDRTTYIRVQTDAAVAIRVAANPTAVTTDTRMAAGAVEYFAVGPGQKLAAITT